LNGPEIVVMTLRAKRLDFGARSATTVFMTVEELMRCAKPLIFENEDEDFSYSIQGTIFLATYENRHFGITAKHALRNRTKESVRLEFNPGDKEFLPLNAMHLPSTPVGDEDFADLAIFEVESKMVNPEIFSSGHFLDLKYFSQLPCLFYRDSVLVLKGYPSEKNSVDYERKVIHTQAFACEAAFSGPGESTHCSKISFKDLALVEDLDGMSGSPVIKFDRTAMGFAYVFAGVLIRAGRAAAAGRIINCDVVYKAMQILNK
jgi:hypothetical protein